MRNSLDRRALLAAGAMGLPVLSGPAVAADGHTRPQRGGAAPAVHGVRRGLRLSDFLKDDDPAADETAGVADALRALFETPRYTQLDGEGLRVTVSDRIAMDGVHIAFGKSIRNLTLSARPDGGAEDYFLLDFSAMTDARNLHVEDCTFIMNKRANGIRMPMQYRRFVIGSNRFWGPRRYAIHDPVKPEGGSHELMCLNNYCTSGFFDERPASELPTFIRTVNGDADFIGNQVQYCGTAFDFSSRAARFIANHVWGNGNRLDPMTGLNAGNGNMFITTSGNNWDGVRLVFSNVDNPDFSISNISVSGDQFNVSRFDDGDENRWIVFAPVGDAMRLDNVQIHDNLLEDGFPANFRNVHIDETAGGIDWGASRGTYIDEGPARANMPPDSVVSTRFSRTVAVAGKPSLIVDFDDVLVSGAGIRSLQATHVHARGDKAPVVMHCALTRAGRAVAIRFFGLGGAPADFEGQVAVRVDVVGD